MGDGLCLSSSPPPYPFLFSFLSLGCVMTRAMYNNTEVILGFLFLSTSVFWSGRQGQTRQGRAKNGNRVSRSVRQRQRQIPPRSNSNSNSSSNNHNKSPPPSKNSDPYYDGRVLFKAGLRSGQKTGLRSGQTCTVHWLAPSSLDLSVPLGLVPPPHACMCHAAGRRDEPRWEG